MMKLAKIVAQGLAVGDGLVEQRAPGLRVAIDGVVGRRESRRPGDADAYGCSCLLLPLQIIQDGSNPMRTILQRHIRAETAVQRELRFQKLPADRLEREGRVDDLIVHLHLSDVLARQMVRRQIALCQSLWRARMPTST